MTATDSNALPGPRVRPRGRPALTQDQRQTALAAAGDLLAEVGPEGMKAREIAKRAGLSVGSIYKQFGDIDDLIRTLNLQTYQAFAEHHRSALDDVNAQTEDVLKRLMALARAYVGFVRDNGPRWRALLAYTRRTDIEQPAAYQAIEDELYGVVGAVLADLPGCVDADECRDAVEALWASVHGIVVLVVPDPAQPTDEARALAHIERVVGAYVRDAGG